MRVEICYEPLPNLAVDFIKENKTVKSYAIKSTVNRNLKLKSIPIFKQ
jgi:hypothetical protein